MLYSTGIYTQNLVISCNGKEFEKECVYTQGLPRWLVVKNLPANAGDITDTGSIPGSERSPGEGHGNPLQYSAWRISWTGEPDRLQSLGSQRKEHN